MGGADPLSSFVPLRGASADFLGISMPREIATTGGVRGTPSQRQYSIRVSRASSEIAAMPSNLSNSRI